MNPPPARAWRWWVCGALLLATLLNYMDRQALSQTATELKTRYQLDDGRYGQIERWFSIAFGLGSIGFGWLADRFGPRRVYPVVLIGWSLAGIATPFAGSPGAIAAFETPDDAPGAGTFRWLLLCRIVLGAFEAGHWPCALITARQILTAAERPFGNSVLQSGASMGAVLTPLYVLLVHDLGGGWEIVFWSIGLAGMLWVPLWAGMVRPGDLDGPPPPAADGSLGPTGWALLVRMFIQLTIATCLALSWQFIRAWLPKYLQESRHYSESLSAWIVAGYYIVADLGCLLSGFAVTCLVARGWGVHPARSTVFAGYCGLSLLAVTVPFLESEAAVAGVLMLVGAGILGLHPQYYALAQELPTRRMGLLSGFLVAGTWITVGQVQGALGAHIKATGSYAEGFTIAGLAPLVGLAALLILWRAKSSR